MDTSSISCFIYSYAFFSFVANTIYSCVLILGGWGSKRCVGRSLCSAGDRVWTRSAPANQQHNTVSEGPLQSKAETLQYYIKNPNSLHNKQETSNSVEKKKHPFLIWSNRQWNQTRSGRPFASTGHKRTRGERKGEKKSRGLIYMLRKGN